LPPSSSTSFCYSRACSAPLSLTCIPGRLHHPLPLSSPPPLALSLSFLSSPLPPSLPPSAPLLSLSLSPDRSLAHSLLLSSSCSLLPGPSTSSQSAVDAPAAPHTTSVAASGAHRPAPRQLRAVQAWLLPALHHPAAPALRCVVSRSFLAALRGAIPPCSFYSSRPGVALLRLARLGLPPCSPRPSPSTLPPRRSCRQRRLSIQSRSRAACSPLPRLPSLARSLAFAYQCRTLRDVWRPRSGPLAIASLLHCISVFAASNPAGFEGPVPS